MNLVIDIGNTNGKVAVFENDILIEKNIFKKKDLFKVLKEIKKKFQIRNTILSTVVKFTEKEVEETKKLFPFLELSSTTKVPFKNLYKTPNTLGLDRIALISNAAKQYPNKNVLVIDAGSCITYDFVNDKLEYLGGSISPGITMRFKAMHHFTSKLPLLEKNNIDNFLGKSTQESMQTGVVYGVLNEIEGFINTYQKKYEHLTVVLTGGDTKFLSKQLKSSIFANQNFLLEGLNNILIFNLDK
jgi:type III pantothenate kinase